MRDQHEPHARERFEVATRASFDQAMALVESNDAGSQSQVRFIQRVLPGMQEGHAQVRFVRPFGRGQRAIAEGFPERFVVHCSPSFKSIPAAIASTNTTAPSAPEPSETIA